MIDEKSRCTPPNGVISILSRMMGEQVDSHVSGAEVPTMSFYKQNGIELSWKNEGKERAQPRGQMAG
jgi:hypothetical protein